MALAPIGWVKWLAAPVWLAQVFTAAKTCDLNPILGDPGLNRRGLHVWRGRLAGRLAARRRRKLERLISPEDRRAFERDGLIVKPGFAAPGQFARLLDELAAFEGEAVDVREGDCVNRKIALTPANLGRLPACRELVSSPGFQGLVRYVSSFDVAPSLYVQTIFSRVGRAKPDHQTRLHMDTFHPTMKAWLFLHDVGEGEGPFTYVLGSQRRTPRRDAWERRMSIEASDPSTPSKGGSFRIGTGELERLECASPTPIHVAANTLVVADTYGFHARGVSTAPSVRIAIYASSRPSPFLPWPALPRLGSWIAALATRLRRRARAIAAPTSPPVLEPEAGR